MTTTIEDTITSERPTDGSELTASAQQARFPVLFWAAVILFVVNLLVLVGIWLSPELRVGFYGIESGKLSGSYTRPSPFDEQVTMSASRKVKQPEKVRPVLYQEPQSMEAAELDLPRASMPAMTERSAYIQKVVNEYSSDMPRMTASAARQGDRPAHVGTLDVAPRKATEQP